MSVEKKYVEYVKATQPLLAKAAELERSIANKAPSTVDALIKAGFLLENQRSQAIVSLQDPLRALESLEKTAAEFHRKTSMVAPLGEPMISKSASTEKAEKGSAADDKFLRDFGLIQ
jgi:hypothetical protein